MHGGMRPRPAHGAQTNTGSRLEAHGSTRSGSTRVAMEDVPRCIGVPNNAEAYCFLLVLYVSWLCFAPSTPAGAWRGYSGPTGTRSLPHHSYSAPWGAGNRVGNRMGNRAGNRPARLGRATRPRRERTHSAVSQRNSGTSSCPARSLTRPSTSASRSDTGGRRGARVPGRTRPPMEVSFPDCERDW